jgi:hypothetical protein
VDEAGDEALEELALAEDDHRLVAGPPGEVARAVGGLAQPDQLDEQLRPAREQEAADRESRGEGDGSNRDVYGPRAFLSSAVMAGTISLRSPITA